MSHVGQRLSALIDGELDGESRDRVLVHLAKCQSCRDEAIALRTLKRRMNALGGETETSSALTGRLMGLAALTGGLDGRPGVPLTPWSAIPVAADRGWPDGRSAWYLLGGAFTVFLAGLSTAAFMAGGSPQPEPRITPAVDVFVLQHDMVTGEMPAAQPAPSQPGIGRPGPGGSLRFTPHHP